MHELFESETYLDKILNSCTIGKAEQTKADERQWIPYDPIADNDFPSLT
jgi:hypothetical protein